jgi:hypothetical protein
VNDVAVERERDAKAAPGKLAGPASYAAGLANSSCVFRAELPAVTEDLAARCPRHCRRTSRPRRQTARFTPRPRKPRPFCPLPQGRCGLSRSRHTRLSRRRHTPLANVMVSADPLGRAWDAHPTKGTHRP